MNTLNNFYELKPYAGVDGKVNELVQQYQQSGTKQTFWQWLKSEQGKSVINDTIALGFALINKDKIDQQLQQQQEDLPPIEDDEFTILGMNPLTFGVVAVSTLVASAVLIGFLNKKTKAKTK